MVCPSACFAPAVCWHLECCGFRKAVTLRNLEKVRSYHGMACRKLAAKLTTSCHIQVQSVDFGAAGSWAEWLKGTLDESECGGQGALGPRLDVLMEELPEMEASFSLSCSDQSVVVCFQVEASLEEGRRHVAPLDLITLRRCLSHTMHWLIESRLH